MSHDMFMGAQRGFDTAYSYYDFTAIPISFRLPGDTTTHPVDNQETMQRRYKDYMESQSGSWNRNANAVYETQSDTVEERMKGWIEETRVKISDGRTDKYYHYEKTGKRCRSLAEAHQYINGGNSPQGDSKKKRYMGKTYLRRQIIGSYDFNAKAVIKQGEQRSTNGNNKIMVGVEEKKLDETPIESMLKKSSMEKATEDHNDDKTEAPKYVSTYLYMNFEFIKK